MQKTCLGSVMKIVSGGQTGADQAGLEWAIDNGIPHGGFCPRGRKCENGIIPAKFKLQETIEADYPERTKQNVINSSGTVIFTSSPKLSRGSQLTSKLANAYQKPVLHLHHLTANPGKALARFIQQFKISVLNIAGSRASTDPSVAALVKDTLDEAIRYFANDTGNERIHLANSVFLV